MFHYLLDWSKKYKIVVPWSFYFGKCSTTTFDEKRLKLLDEKRFIWNLDEKLIYWASLVYDTVVKEQNAVASFVMKNNFIYL